MTCPDTLFFRASRPKPIFSFFYPWQTSVPPIDFKGTAFSFENWSYLSMSEYKCVFSFCQGYKTWLFSSKPAPLDGAGLPWQNFGHNQKKSVGSQHY